jgi:serine/threonine-protein kinase RsbW
MKKSTLKLKSRLSDIHRLEKFVEDICDEYNINNTYFGNILVSLTEALENAIVHGNGSNPDKNVSITFESLPKGLLFQITDEGPGFDFTNIPDATDPVSNPEKKGTGIFLIRTLADEVQFADTGRTIQIMFYISSINQQIAAERISQLDSFTKAEKETREKEKEQ